MESVSITSAYMWAFVTLVVLFLAAVLIANAVMYKPNDPGTTTKRIWFWILCVCTGVISYVINYFVAKNIETPSLHSAYMTNAGIAALLSIVIFIIVGLIVSKIFSNSKIGTWF